MTTAQLAPTPIFRSVDNNGNPLVGGLLWTYAAGTSTPQASYPSSSELTPNTNPIVLNARGECALWLDPTLSYKLLLTDSLGNTIPGYPVDNIVGPGVYISGFITQNSVGTALWPITPAEIAAGIVPGPLAGNLVNYFYQPGVVDRYGTNTTPGTTSMAAAFQAAINQAKAGGVEVTYGDTTTYLIDSQLNLTTAPGTTNYAISIRGRANNAAVTTNPPYYPAIVLKTTGNAFDCTGNTGINFQNMSITTDTSTHPSICFLLARNTAIGNGQIVRFDNVRIYGLFSDCVIYNFGSEDDVHVGCQYTNAIATSGGSPCVMRLTAYNVSNVTSSFTSIATSLPQSTIDHTFTGCQFEILSTSTTADLIQYDGVADVRFYGCWGYMAGGRAMHFHDGANAISQSVSIRDWVTESISAQNYFADFNNFAGSPSGWRFDNVVSYEATKFLNVEGVTPILDEFNLTQILDVSSKGINIPGTLQNSVVYYFNAMTIGTSTGNELHGDPSVWSITTRSLDFWYGWASSALTWTPGTGAITHGGTLTVNNKTIDYIGRQVTATLAIADSVSMSWAANAAITGLPIAVTVGGGVVVVTNATTGLSIGTGWVNGTSIKLPVLTTGSTNTIVITATYFAA